MCVCVALFISNLMLGVETKEICEVFSVYDRVHVVVETCWTKSYHGKTNKI